MSRRTEVAGFILISALLVSLIFVSEGRDRVFPIVAQVLATMGFVRQQRRWNKPDAKNRK